MPTYEYVCGACGHAFEKFQSMSSEPIKTCPACGADQAQRQISGGAGFILKGSGFYETDYRSDAYKKSAEADKAPGADIKSETKPSEPAAAEAKPAESKPAEVKPAAATPPPAPTKSEAAKAPPTPPPAGG